MKMYFFYGVMGYSKTAIALMKKFNFEEHGKKVLLAKPAIDTRDGEKNLKSRVGLENKAVVLNIGESLQEKVQDLFLADRKFMVMCYGLKTDFMSRLFEGSKRLLELVDCIREIPAPCKCGKKATSILKVDNDKVIVEGEQIDLGGNEKYLSVCHKCYAASVLCGHPVNCKN